MDWFKRATRGLAPQAKKDIPELWVKCEACGEIIYKRQLEQNFYMCTNCGHHFRIKASDYIRLLADEGTFEEFNQDILPTDFVKFKAKKKYADQLKDVSKKTDSTEAIRTGYCHLNGRPVILGVLDFAYIGGSMGSVMGERIALAADRAIDEQKPLIIVSASGGARMMEGAISLMQLAKTSARLTRLAEAHIPYISVLTHPTTGGVTASFAMLGDINIGEPGALIGFAGPRVIKQTIGEDLPEGFQTAEFLLEHGFLDAVLKRSELKAKIDAILDILYNDELLANETSNGAINAADMKEAKIAPPLAPESQKN